MRESCYCRYLLLMVFSSFLVLFFLGHFRRSVCPAVCGGWFRTVVQLVGVCLLSVAAPTDSRRARTGTVSGTGGPAQWEDEGVGKTASKSVGKSPAPPREKQRFCLLSLIVFTPALRGTVVMFGVGCLGSVLESAAPEVGVDLYLSVTGCETQVRWEGSAALEPGRRRGGCGPGCD